MMKKWVLILAVAVSLAACNLQPPGKGKPVGTKDVIEENPVSYENDSFKEVVVTQSEDEIIVTGKAQVFEGVFQYALYNGEIVLAEDHYQTEGAPAWGEFTLTFKNDLVTKNEMKLELFFYSAKDGAKTNILEIPF
ncbi:Gmad2 immunoglobulin-like domain-containing protein [Rossellomorea aquimaris]|uniref:Gmad2 immunoglobulin-like domain-containing protein n=1 Tax=Rossellomorea aquimaris TaxID=189382 RepID=UPI001CD77FC1|nr:Gmad2 immunoglobulin-like domain-containing protein [Rossellomorea aquimaris]MCA1060240.1 Gmad2 immunoglobulin-like domain-containing protein [Rossellomorea aquimaris]